MSMLTRRHRTVVSPSLVLNEPSARMGLQSPSLGSAASVPDNHFRPVSPSLYIPELMPSPTASPCASPSLGLIPEEAMRRAAEMQAQQNNHARTDRSARRPAKNTTRMTTAVCKRASRMARPSEPSEAALLEADREINATEDAMRRAGLEKLTLDEISLFKHTAPSTGKGPAVRAGTGDAESDVAAQAVMNHVRCFRLLFCSCASTHAALPLTLCFHSRCDPLPPSLAQMVSIKSRRVDTNNQEPSWLMDVHNACPHMYGRLAANAIKRYAHHPLPCRFPMPIPDTHTLACSNAVNSSVTKRAKTQGAANQVRLHGTRPAPRLSGEPD